jgi:hypothetical protein
MLWMASVGTDDGTLVHAIIATFGDEVGTTIWLLGTLATSEIGRTTGLDQVDGTGGRAVVYWNDGTNDGTGVTYCDCGT